MSDSFELIVLPGMSTPQVGSGPVVDTRSLENPSVSLSDPDTLAEAFGWSLPTESGQAVNPGRALSLSTFWAAVKMISGDVSRLPMATFRRRPNGLRPIADDSHQLWPFLQPLGMANEELSTLKMWRRAMVHALVYENAYIWLDWSANGRLRGMYNLLSDRTIVARVRGKLWVVTEIGDVTTGGPRMVAKPYDEVLHIEGLCIDGLVGCDMIYQARDDLGVALAARQFKSKFFGEGMHAGGVLQVPPGASATNVRKMEDAIKEQHASSNKAFRTLVMRDGFKWFSTQVNPQQAEMTQMDETEIRNLCRRFLMQPGRMGLRDSVSYNSLEAEKRDYYDTTLSYWASVIRAEINVKGLTEAERRQWLIDYNVSLALLWADASTLITVATQGVNARDSEGKSIFDADEVRAWFQLPERESEAAAHADTDDSNDDQDPEPTEPAADDTEGGSDSDPDGDVVDDMRQALRELLAAELRRAIRRLNVGTARAARKQTLPQWSVDLERENRPLLNQSLAPVVAVCRAHGNSTASAEKITDDLLSEYVSAMCAAQLPMDWDDKDWRVDLADQTAEVWIQ